MTKEEIKNQINILWNLLKEPFEQKDFVEMRSILYDIEFYELFLRNYDTKHFEQWTKNKNL